MSIKDIRHDLYRPRKINDEYHKYVAKLPKELGCEFCTFAIGHPQVLEDYGDFLLIKNRFPYDVWDRYRVLDHLFLIPKRHVDEITQFTADEDSAFLHILKDFEERGYSVYARAKNSKSKSVPHQHTHFMKLDDKPVHTIVYNKDLGRIVK